MLTESEKQKLNEKELQEYNALDENEREIFAVAFRADNSEETPAPIPERATNETARMETVVKVREEIKLESDGNGGGTTGSGVEVDTGKEKRGRHKLGCACEKCVQKRSATGKTNLGAPTNGTATKTAEQQLEDDLKGYERREVVVTNIGGVPQVQPVAPKLDITKFISGALFLLVLDAAFPPIVKYGFGMVEPKYRRIKNSSLDKLKLDKTERELLEPSANELVKYLFADANPILIFFMGAGALYSSKFIMLNENDFEHVPNSTGHKPVHKQTGKAGR